MPKVKVPRKSTSVDMTAMCDVAFLLLSFFILTTSFKPDEALEVTNPKSVQTKLVETKNAVTVTMDKEGKVYFSMSDDNREEKELVFDFINKAKNLGLGDAEKRGWLRNGSFVGVPFGQLKSYLAVPAENIKGVKQAGIPVTDTLNNEMVLWIQAAKDAFKGKTMALVVKGDQNAMYPSFKGVIDAFKKNDEFKFQTVTDPENVPLGTELYKTNQKRGVPAEGAQ